MSDYLIQLDDVFVRYPAATGGTKTVLNGINLKVRPGELVTVVGPSGCGKSTMLRLILGAEQPGSGSVSVESKPVLSPSRERGIVFQRYSLFPHLTVLENIAFGLDLEEFSMAGRWVRPLRYRKRRREFAAEARDYLARMQLAEAADKHPHELSGGMRQRVAIAQAAIMRPKVLLMDEPFGALDDTTRQSMQRFLLELWEKTKMTVFFVTHDLEEALFLGTRVVVLSQFYSDDVPVEGSKIVVDREVPGEHPQPNGFKYSSAFTELLSTIRHGGLDPDVRQHVREFDLSHLDAWRG